jgi:hypothetical protein
MIFTREIRIVHGRHHSIATCQHYNPMSFGIPKSGNGWNITAHSWFKPLQARPTSRIPKKRTAKDFHVHEGDIFGRNH